MVTTTSKNNLPKYSSLFQRWWNHLGIDTQKRTLNNAIDWAQRKTSHEILQSSYKLPRNPKYFDFNINTLLSVFELATYDQLLETQMHP